MAYSEEKDLIQNVKDLREIVDKINGSVSELGPSIEEILALRDEFEGLADKTIGVIEQYEASIKEKDDEYNALLSECRSQFKQVTNDVEALVNLEVNFQDIKDRIELCIQLSDEISELAKGPFVLMKGKSDYVPVEDRLPYKHYLKVISAAPMTGGIPTAIKVSPTMGISLTEP